VRLTLQPGVTIIFSADVGLGFSADQVLIAAGTAAEPILLTGAQATRGFWKGISFDGTLKPDSVLDYVVVEYAGQTKSDKDAAAVKMTADSRGVRASITNTTLRESQGWGLYLAASAIVPGFSGNTITKNQLGPVMVGSEAAHQLLTTSTYVGNDIDQVAVAGNRVNKAVTWQAIGVPYVIDSGISVDLVWTLAPGVTLLMGPGAWLSIAGDAAGLHAAGTAAAPILISGLQKTAGFWESIVFDTTLNGANAFDFCTVEYGGGGTAKGDLGMIIAKSDSHGVTLSVTNSKIQYSAVYGLWLGGAAISTLSGNTYTGNAMGDIYQQP